MWQNQDVRRRKSTGRETTTRHVPSRCLRQQKSCARPLIGRSRFSSQKNSALLTPTQCKRTQCTNQKKTGCRKRYFASRTARVPWIAYRQTVLNVCQHDLSPIADTRIRPNDMCVMAEERRRDCRHSLTTHLAAVARRAEVAPRTAPPESGRICSGTADGQKTNYSKSLGEFHYFPHTDYSLNTHNLK